MATIRSLDHTKSVLSFLYQASHFLPHPMDRELPGLAARNPSNSYSITDHLSHRSEAELAVNIRKATNVEETAPKRKHVRSAIVYTWDHKSSQSFWAGMKVYVGDNSGDILACVQMG